jgi:hypothetical protein
VILNDSVIKADAISGNGGNITITADQFIASVDSRVQASSATGISGNITILAPANTVTASLVDLSKRLGRPPVLYRTDCTRVAEQVGLSSVVPVGRGALPEDGSGPQSARYFIGRPMLDASLLQPAGAMPIDAGVQPFRVSLADSASAPVGCR